MIKAASPAGASSYNSLFRFNRRIVSSRWVLLVGIRASRVILFSYSSFFAVSCASNAICSASMRRSSPSSCCHALISFSSSRILSLFTALITLIAVFLATPKGERSHAVSNSGSKHRHPWAKHHSRQKYHSMAKRTQIALRGVRPGIAKKAYNATLNILIRTAKKTHAISRALPPTGR